MSTLAERLTLAMKGETEVKAAELARACKVKPPSVADWLSGKTKKMEGANLLAAAELLKVDPWWLATGEGSMTRGDNAPAPHREWNIGPEAQELCELTVAADRARVPPTVFESFSAAMRVFIAQYGAGAAGSAEPLPSGDRPRGD